MVEPSSHRIKKQEFDNPYNSKHEPLSARNDPHEKLNTSNGGFSFRCSDLEDVEIANLKKI